MNRGDQFHSSQVVPSDAAREDDRGMHAVCGVRKDSAMEVALLIVALVPLSNAMPLVGLPGGVLLGSFKGIYESDSPAMLRSGRVLATGDQASGTGGLS